MEKGIFHETQAGTPQGGVISPLLANIALHGLEEALEIKHYTRGDLNSTRAVVRYADDFCVFCESLEDAETAKQVLTDWLSERGLTLSAEKTTIVHLTEGLNFLGFHIRLYRASNTKTGWKLRNFAKQGSCSETPRADETSMGGSTWMGYWESLVETEPQYSRMGELLPNRNRQRNLSQTGRLDVLQGGKAYQANPPTQIQEMATTPLLGQAES